MIRQSIQCYRLLVRLYPRRFRAEFGREMIETFSEMLRDRVDQQGRRGALWAWFCIAKELVPSLIREHMDAFSPGRIVGPAGAVFVPAAVYAALLQQINDAGQQLILATWLACTGIGIAIARGRGTRCICNAIVGSSAAIAGVFAISPAPVGPGPLVIIPLMLAVGATLALVLSTYVRLMIEGIEAGGPHVLSSARA